MSSVPADAKTPPAPSAGTSSSTVQHGAIDVLDSFHPAVSAWFRRTFARATPAQQAAWPLIRERRPTLVAAPTGSGKTLTAFLAAIDELVREGVAAPGGLPDATTVIYISPLKALSNDIRLNLEAPLAGIARELEDMGLPDAGIRAQVRTGDTPQRERQAMRKRAPHILVTTPESLYVLLGSDSGRAMLATTRTVIVDEIHAVAGSKRGSHLALSLARLDALCRRPPLRIGLSATQKPLTAVARFLAGAARGSDCAIVDIGHDRRRDLAIELPPVPLEAVMATDVWDAVYDRMAELAAAHRTTLVFVNTRRMAERAARHLAERLGAQAVAAHHGSLAKEHRLQSEQRLKGGELKVLVATASLELGIDIGDVDLVCQVGSPRGISALLQRVGRSGHHVGGIPKGRLFPSSRDDLVECAALLACVRRGELDTLRIPDAPLDVLAQHMVAEVACREWREDELFDLMRQAQPYAALSRDRFDAVLHMLTEGHPGSAGHGGTRAAYLHRDTVARTVRGRRGSRLTAVTSGGTIPDNADYAVLLEPQNLNIGTVNEDFAVESLAGDVFQLGNTSYRILRVEAGRVRVEDAQGMAPNIPFWLGEAPGRSDELSAGVARLRAGVDRQLARAAQDAAGKVGNDGKKRENEQNRRTADEAASIVDHDDGGTGTEAAIEWLREEAGIDVAAARQIVGYLARARACLGALPTHDTLAMERFFDESGGMQLVLHAPFGSRVNRAWGLALRKRFCRTFNFELQAAATEDAIVLSLSTAHSFELGEVWHYLHSATAEQVLVQALLDAPLFNVRWRWNANTALALPRYTGGRKVAPQLQRMKSDDLLAAVFPDQAACLENIEGERELPSHPLVEQTLDDCLHEAMDCAGWLAVLSRIERGELTLVTRDLPAPSPLAMEILGARPYAFLDDAPLEERRAQAVMARRWNDAEAAGALGALDAAAIELVATEAWPQPRSVDEMHEALMDLACITQAESEGSGPEPGASPSSKRAAGNAQWLEWLQALAAQGRACCLHAGPDAIFWVALERLDCLAAVHPRARFDPVLQSGEGDMAWTRDDALVEIVRARLGGQGPTTAAAMARMLALPQGAIDGALARLENEGVAMRGRYTPGTMAEEWCERHLLARIHRYTIKQLRREIEPVSRQDFMRFLLDWQHLSAHARMRGPQSLPVALARLEGYEAPAGAWEDELLAARLADYSPSWLDDFSRAGKVAWIRMAPKPRTGGPRAAAPVRTTPIAILPRRFLGLWQEIAGNDVAPEVSPRAQDVHQALLREGALFYDELAAQTRLLPSELEDALGELVSAGMVTADSFTGLRALLLPAAKRHTLAGRRRRGGAMPEGLEMAGRWAPVRAAAPAGDEGSLRNAAGNSPAASSSSSIATADSPAIHGDTARAPGHSPVARGIRTRLAPDVLEHLVMALLHRYGVVFWRLLDREADWLPPWRELQPVLHRLEARGSVRGGRFVAGLAGEQFALPEAIPVLRQVRRTPPDGALVRISAADPLNLCGSLLPGDRVPALAGNRVLFQDGLPIAALVAGKVQELQALQPETRKAAQAALLGGVVAL